MPQQRVKDRRARPADFAPARAGAMLQFEPVRFNLEEAFVAREFFRRVAVRRRWQTLPGVGFNFFDQILHGRINWEQTGFKASHAVTGWSAGVLEYWENPFLHHSIAPLPRYGLEQRNLFVRAAAATLCPRCQTNLIRMPS